MNLGRFSLIFAAIAFFVYGAAFLFFPTLMTSLLGIELPVPSAIIDVRATYGGSVLGTAVFFALCSLRDELLRPGLIAQVAVLGGFIFGRVMGFIVDREPNVFIYVLLVGEILGLLIALIGLRSDVKNQQKFEPSAETVP
ncbi:MAG: DUF4345 domain-containing protein [Nostocales cyanobacterium]|nr:MAG: DUF4345 domain-containing protein [Nostocales cyanobacterium]